MHHADGSTRVLACAVLLKAWQDATQHWRDGAVALQARRFLSGVERGSMLPFWCALAGVDLGRVQMAARRWGKG
jgi:hypothetical protein